MSGDQLNLDAIEARMIEAGEAPEAILWLAGIARGYVPALVAEVRHLRARFRLCDGCDATMVRCNEHIEAGAIKCCPDCKHAERP